MLAINSAPDTSVGYFCAGGGNGVEEVLAAALAGRLKSSKLARMRVDLGERVISTRVLNDALYCHESPAATSRYIIEHGGESGTPDVERRLGWAGRRVDGGSPIGGRQGAPHRITKDSVRGA